jgi:hypothetical protein
MTSSTRASTVRVAVVQAGSVPFDAEACVAKAVRLLGDAAAGGCYVVIGVIERELGTCYCTVLAGPHFEGETILPATQGPWWDCG